VFLINSRRSRFTVAAGSVNRQRHPLSRTYGAILQSSLTSVLPSALDYSSRLPVSVLVRSPGLQPLEAFLGRLSDDFPNINAVGPGLRLGGGGFACPPPNIRSTDVSTRTAHPSKRRPSIGPPRWRRNVDLLSIVYAFRPRLRDRLTLGGITFPRKP
jgi:hypothetical protein